MMNRAERRFRWKGLKFKGYITPADEAILCKYSEISGHDINELRFLHVNAKEWDRPAWIDGINEMIGKIESGAIVIVEKTDRD